MTLFESVLLGLVQGLGEFLPISSSAHLVIFPWLFRFPDPGLTFSVALHFGTLIALLIFFWQDWIRLTVGSIRHLLGSSSSSSDDKQNYHMMIFLVIATIPGALAGLLLEELAETVFRSPLLVAFNMSALGALLYWVDARKLGKRELGDLNLKDAVLIGLSQVLALVPGVSRSGITMTAGLGLGLSRVGAARFSFLMATPIVLGAAVLKLPHFLNSSLNLQSLVGIATAGVVGYLSIKYLLRYVQTHSYRIFAYYRFGFSLVVVMVYFLN